MSKKTMSKKTMSKKTSFGLGLIFSLALLPSLTLAAASGPVLISPSNNAKNYNPAVTTIYWSKVPGASGYDFEINQDSNDFSSSADLQAINSGDKNFLLPTEINTATLIAPGALANGKTYYWRVRSIIAGASSNWSNVFKFSTAAAPGAPTLTFPVIKSSNGKNVYQSINKSQTKDFSWKLNGSDIAFNILNVYPATTWPETGKPVCDLNNPALADFVVQGGKVSSSILATLPSGNYCWVVASYSNSAGPGVTSDFGYFSLATSSVVPNLIFSQTGFNGALFYWSKVANIGSGYQLKISKKADMSDSPQYTNATIPTNYFFVNSDSPLYSYIKTNKNLFWQVRANATGAWSKVSSFKSNFLSAPVIIGPKSSETQITATSSVLKWSVPTGAKFYRAEIKQGEESKKVGFTGSGSYKIPAGLNLAPGAYTWEVTAYSDFDKSPAATNGAFTAK